MRTRDDMAALPIGMSRSLLAIAGVSISLGAIFFLSGPQRLNSPGFRPAQAVGIDPLSIGFIAIGVFLIVAWRTGRYVILALRLHSFYFAFWACMFIFAGIFFNAPFTAVPVYLGLCGWSMLCVATLKQWRRIGGTE